MVSGAERPAKDIHTAPAENIQQTAASAKLHDDARPLHIIETPGGGRIFELKVLPHDTLRNLGRELYGKYAHHQPSKGELDAFINDAAKRNKLTTPYARNHLPLGEPLKLALPGVAPPPKEKMVPVAVPVPTPATPHNLETRALMKGSSSCSGPWSNMVAQWVTHNEVSQQRFLAFNPNDHGAGISIGLLQWNQKKGSLPELLKDWHEKDPAKFNRMFGGYAAGLLKADFVRSADFVGTPILNQGIHSALADGEFQEVQLALRNAHIVKSCEVAQSNGFSSLRGRAVVADLFNQIGERGTVHALQKVSASKPESMRIEDLKKLTGGRVNGHDRVSSIEDNVKDIWRKLGSK